MNEIYWYIILVILFLVSIFIIYRRDIKISAYNLEMKKDLQWVHINLGIINILNEDQERMAGVRKHINILLSRYDSGMSESIHLFVPSTFEESHQEPRYQLEALAKHLTFTILIGRQSL